MKYLHMCTKCVCVCVSVDFWSNRTLQVKYITLNLSDAILCQNMQIDKRNKLHLEHHVDYLICIKLKDMYLYHAVRHINLAKII